LSRGAVPLQLSRDGQLASGISLTADPAGDQLAGWKQCDPAITSCAAYVASRPTAALFSAPARLGPIDLSQNTAIALSPIGMAAAGRVVGGFAYVSVRPGAAGRFGAPSAVSGATSSDLALAAGPHGRVIAVWTQGTSPASVKGALYR